MHSASCQLLPLQCATQGTLHGHQRCAWRQQKFTPEKHPKNRWNDFRNQKKVKSRKKTREIRKKPEDILWKWKLKWENWQKNNSYNIVWTILLIKHWVLAMEDVFLLYCDWHYLGYDLDTYIAIHNMNIWRCWPWHVVFSQNKNGDIANIIQWCWYWELDTLTHTKMLFIGKKHRVKWLKWQQIQHMFKHEETLACSKLELNMPHYEEH